MHTFSPLTFFKAFCAAGITFDRKHNDKIQIKREKKSIVSKQTRIKFTRAKPPAPSAKHLHSGCVPFSPLSDVSASERRRNVHPNNLFTLVLLLLLHRCHSDCAARASPLSRPLWRLRGSCDRCRRLKPLSRS